MIGTQEPGKDSYMKMAAFGQLAIEVTPDAANPEILNVDMAAQFRKEGVHMKTNKDETVDQFAARIRSMLRSLSNGEPRVAGEIVTGKEPVTQPKTWEEQKKAMKHENKQTI